MLTLPLRDAVGVLQPGSMFPRTRYQGSKRRLIPWIIRELAGLRFRSALDAFGGTGAVSYAFKQMGKHVTFNDILSFNHQIGLALIENDDEWLPDDLVSRIGSRWTGRPYGDVIESEFAGIYYTDDENRWLDVAIGNIRCIEPTHRRAMAWFALFQSALAKRPFNLFHRRNLYLRTASVERSFGNKATWDRPFEQHFRRAAAEVNQAVFPSETPCRAACRDALTVEGEFDLVYMDPPYMNRKKVGVNYRTFYHFLEGMVMYDQWPERIDRRSKNRRLMQMDNPWLDPNRIGDQFARLFRRYHRSILVVSYRSDGTPSIDDLVASMKTIKKSVSVRTNAPRPYALSSNRASREVLIIGTH